MPDDGTYELNEWYATKTHENEWNDEKIKAVRLAVEEFMNSVEDGGDPFILGSKGFVTRLANIVDYQQYLITLYRVRFGQMDDQRLEIEAVMGARIKQLESLMAKEKNDVRKDFDVLNHKYDELEQRYKAQVEYTQISHASARVVIDDLQRRLAAANAKQGKQGKQGKQRKK